MLASAWDYTVTCIVSLPSTVFASSTSPEPHKNPTTENLHKIKTQTSSNFDLGGSGRHKIGCNCYQGDIHGVWQTGSGCPWRFLPISTHSSSSSFSSTPELLGNCRGPILWRCNDQHKLHFPDLEIHFCHLWPFHGNWVQSHWVPIWWFGQQEQTKYLEQMCSNNA